VGWAKRQRAHHQVTVWIDGGHGANAPLPTLRDNAADSRQARAAIVPAHTDSIFSNSKPCRSTQLRDLAAHLREVCSVVLPSGTGGRRECRAPAAPAASCAKVESTRVRNHGHTGTPGIPYAMVLTGSFALSPAIGHFCHRRLRTLPSANLTPASRRQDHTTSPSASPRSRQKRASRPPHPAPRP
jgi:hypothetical protein